MKTPGLSAFSNTHFTVKVNLILLCSCCITSLASCVIACRSRSSIFLFADSWERYSLKFPACEDRISSMDVLPPLHEVVVVLWWCCCVTPAPTCPAPSGFLSHVLSW